MKIRLIILLPLLIVFSGCAQPELPQPKSDVKARMPVYSASLESARASMPQRVVIPAPPGCNVCHWGKSQNQSFFYYLPLNFSHKIHTKLAIDCLFCHRKASSSSDIDDDLMPAGHFFKGKESDEAPDRNPCRTCHIYSSTFGQDDEKLPARCDTCHPGYPKKAIKMQRGTYMDGLLNNHSVHIKKGIPCIRCHVDFDKLEATVNRFTPTRSLCEECHGVGVEARNLDTLVPPSGLKIDAEELFMRNCVPCHGEDGKGQGKIASFFRTNLKPRDLTDPSAMDKRSDKQLFDVINEGGTELMLSERMPAWKGLLTEDEVRSLVKYVRGLSSQ